MLPSQTCPKCGAPLQLNSTHCYRCGWKFDQDLIPSPGSPLPPHPSQNDGFHPQKIRPKDFENEDSMTKRKRKRFF